ncbi:c-type cytochrome biogenesis protein CcmI [Oceaniglobus indicus]|uniref:c-type cytochrome biogenesis protein CcmI n=1 Tax=Oceaniglobus indicus TaxID=2047749 RepID=UPI000C1A0AC3|nr:c-type cytochrome biogenesis protein CcmI [Oceaniglobus indicus]
MFWGIAIALAGVVAALIGLSLTRPAGATVDASSDVRIYRDQLDEIDRDLARGTLEPDEAARVRIEVSRRLLEADRATKAQQPARMAPKPATWLAVAGTTALVIGGGLAIYGAIGAPGYPDLPLQTRIEMADQARQSRPGQEAAEAEAAAITAEAEARARATADPSFLTLMDRLRATMETRPDDLEGQRLLARNEAGLNRFGAAAAAQGRVIALKGADATAEDHAELAEYLIYAAGGYVSPEAEAALSAALQRDSHQPTARYYTGLLHAQTGRPDLTFRIWRDLLARGPETAPWIAPIRAQIDELAALAGVRYTQPERGGPDAADVEAMAALGAEDRQAAIEGMVANLSARLADAGGPPEDWVRLIVSLAVLGRDDQAGAILSEARGVFADDAAAMRTLNEAAERAGVQP